MPLKIHYMNTFITQLNLSTHKPVFIKLWNGNFEVRTHPELSVRVDFEGIHNRDLVPVITEDSRAVQIRSQSAAALFVRSDLIKIIIYVPDESVVHIRLVTGTLAIAGSYHQLTSYVGMGNTLCDLQDMAIKHTASLQVLAGDIQIDNDNLSTIKTRAGHESFQQYRYYNQSTVKVSTHFGQVYRTGIEKSKGLCLA